MANITVGVAAAPVTGIDRNQCLVIQNRGSVSIYWGYTASLTTANGVEILAGGAHEWPRPIVNFASAVYLISGTAGQGVRWEHV